MQRQTSQLHPSTLEQRARQTLLLSKLWHVPHQRMTETGQRSLFCWTPCAQRGPAKTPRVCIFLGRYRSFLICLVHSYSLHAQALVYLHTQTTNLVAGQLTSTALMLGRVIFPDSAHGNRSNLYLFHTPALRGMLKRCTFMPACCLLCKDSSTEARLKGRTIEMSVF